MSGHLIPLPGVCAWCGGAALPDTTCPLSLPCSRCLAGPGQRCRRPSGHAAPELHATRWKLAEGMDRAGLTPSYLEGQQALAAELRGDA